jgi:hypothetical protein
VNVAVKNPCCDFCGARPAPDQLVWLPCGTYRRLLITRGRVMHMVGCDCCEPVPDPEPGDHVQEYVSLSAWMACPDCTRDVAAGDREALVERCAQGQMRETRGVSPEHLREIIAGAHVGYWRHRQPVN